MEMDYEPGRPVSHWQEQLDMVQKDASRSRLKGLGTIAVGAGVLLLSWIVMNFANAIIVWLWVIGGALVLIGVIQIVFGPAIYAKDVEKAKDNLRRAQDAAASEQA